MSGSKGNDLELSPPPPTELLLPQLCLAVSAKELMVVERGMKGRRFEEVDQSEDSITGISPEEGKVGGGEGGIELFRRRKPLPYFTVDCRPKEQVGGRWGLVYIVLSQFRIRDLYWGPRVVGGSCRISRRFFSFRELMRVK